MLHLKQDHHLKSLCLLSILTTFLLLAMLAVPAAAETKTPAANAPLEEARVYPMACAKAVNVESVLRGLLTPITAHSDSTKEIRLAREGFFVGRWQGERGLVRIWPTTPLSVCETRSRPLKTDIGS